MLSALTLTDSTFRYDFDVYNDSTKAQIYNAMYGTGNCYDMTVDCYTSGLNDICSASDLFCFAEVENQLDIIAVRDEYDIREPYNDRKSHKPRC